MLRRLWQRIALWWPRKADGVPPRPNGPKDDLLEIAGKYASGDCEPDVTVELHDDGTSTVRRKD